MELENPQNTVESSKSKSKSKSDSNRDHYFIHFIKYEKAIYCLGLVGAISQMFIVVIFLASLISMEGFREEVICCALIAMSLLTGTALSEIFLMRAVNQRMLRYIQWWMFSSVMILFVTIMNGLIFGGVLYNNPFWWVTLAFAYLIVRLPFQMHFVDGFTQAEILHKEAQTNEHYKSVLYRRFL